MGGRKLSTRRLALLITLLCAVLLVGVCLFLAAIQRYDYVYNQASMVSIRELLIRAADGANSTAPVEAKTGDIYFPAARVYLPAPSEPARLTYSYDAISKQLSVSSRGAVNIAVSQLYGAEDLDELFDRVPKLQAYQRGVYIEQKKLEKPGDTELKATITLNDGSKRYLYQEKSCPELQQTTNLLLGLQSY